MSAYKLPDGFVQIAFSGGRTSAFMLHEILQANGSLPEDRVVVTFQNTGREMPQTLDFVREVGMRWQIDIVWLEYRPQMPLFEVIGYQGASLNGEPFEELIRKKKALPNQFQKWCSAELKTKTARRYCRSLGWKHWTSAVGFRADELHRQPYFDKRITTWLPLRDAAIGKHDVVSFWKAQAFDLHLPVHRGKTIGGNCDGCFLKSEAALAGFCRDYPERHMWWERLEQSDGHGFSKRYKRAQMRSMMERQGDWIFNDESFLCAKDEGECTA